MKQIVIISGKGGTGKTFFSGCLVVFLKNKVIVDCDVDASNLHLLLNPKVKETYDFIGGRIPFIDKEQCTGCGVCAEICKFSAISLSSSLNSAYEIDSLSCEGCTICNYVCPAEAIILRDRLSGQYFISDTENGIFVHARLGVAQENSGKLVTKLRQVAKDIALNNGSEYIVIDGPPGTGCPVIASMTGVDLAVIVTEPTISGIHDLKRVIELGKHFQVSVKAIINKYDLNTMMSLKIEEQLNKTGVDVIGKNPFSEKISQSVKAKTPFLIFSNDEIARHIAGLCKKVIL